MAEAERAQPATHPLWLLPSAMTFVGFYKGIFDFGHFFVRLCSAWLDFCREIWLRLFAATPGMSGALDPAVTDLLTLWVCASLALWVFPLLTPQRDGRVLTTVSALHTYLHIPPGVARALAFVLIGVSVVVVGLPFTAPNPDGASLGEAVQGSTLVTGGAASSWLSGAGAWFSALLVGVAGALLCFVFFVLGPKLEAPLSAAERRDLLIIAIALSVVSAGFVVAAIVMPASGMGPLTKPDAMALALLALIGLVAWRSALPFVQLSVLVGAVFVLDAGYRFFADVWSSVGG